LQNSYIIHTLERLTYNCKEDLISIAKTTHTDTYLRFYTQDESNLCFSIYCGCVGCEAHCT